VWSFNHVEAMPVDRSASSVHSVRYVDNNQVAKANVDWISWHFPVNAHSSTLETISGDAMSVQAVREVAARLATSSTGSEKVLSISFDFKNFKALTVQERGSFLGTSGSNKLCDHLSHINGSKNDL
jgi:type II secretory pathway component GspD/PulD (secretin)